MKPNIQRTGRIRIMRPANEREYPLFVLVVLVTQAFCVGVAIAPLLVILAQATAPQTAINEHTIALMAGISNVVIGIQSILLIPCTFWFFCRRSKPIPSPPPLQ
jgi:hypothetical protein